MPDTPDICRMINYHAERGKMLHRSLEDVYERLRNFIVAEDGGKIVGCAAVEISWADLAEVKSLAVDPDHIGHGIGRQLLAWAVRDAEALGLKRLFALTYERQFFARNGFRVIDKDQLPSKVWRECAMCPRRDACDEIAMVLEL